MPVKVSVGLSKKVGLPNYGSSGASCHVEFELDGSYDNGSTQNFQDAVRRAYVACRQAVEAEFAPEGSDSNVVSDHPGSSPSNRIASHKNGNGPGDVRAATASQIRAIFAIANRNGIDLPGILSGRFGVVRPDDLSIRDASSLIDELKNPGVGNDSPESQ